MTRKGISEAAIAVFLLLAGPHAPASATVYCCEQQKQNGGKNKYAFHLDLTILSIITALSKPLHTQNARAIFADRHAPCTGEKRIKRHLHMNSGV